MSPFKPFYEPKEVIDQIKRLMAEFGPDAFKIDGRTVLYSGPREIIKSALSHLRDNHLRAQAQALAGDDGILDYTEIGLFLEEYDETDDGKFLNIYDYYKHHLGKRNPFAKEFADRVMWFASEEFIKNISGDVLTAICGADLERSFFQVELPGLILNKNVTTMNGIPMEAVRAFYEISPYEALKLICLSELKQTYEKSDTFGAKSPLASWNEFFERMAFYEMEQGDPKGKPTALTAKQKQENKVLIEKYNLKELYEKEPWTWGGPVMSRTKALPPAPINDNASPLRPRLRTTKAIPSAKM